VFECSLYKRGFMFLGGLFIRCELWCLGELFIRGGVLCLGSLFIRDVV